MKHRTGIVDVALVDEMKLFTGFEPDSLSGSYLNFGSSSGVSTDSGLPWFDGKDTKASKLDSVACNEGLFHALENSVYRSLCFCSWQAGPLNNPLYEILFYHSWPPSLALNSGKDVVCETWF